MTIVERFDEKEKQLTDGIIFPPYANTDDLNEKTNQIRENQDIMIENHISIIQNQKILKDELFNLQMEINQLKNKNKSKKTKSKKTKYGLVGLFAFGAIFSAIILPEPVKILSVGFVCPLANQLYYLFRDR